MRKFILLTLFFSILATSVYADLVVPLFYDHLGIQIFLFVGIVLLEAVVFMLLLKGQGAWIGKSTLNWLWSVGLANLASTLAGIPLALGSARITYWYKLTPQVYQGDPRNIWVYAVFLFLALFISVLIEWGVLRMFKVRHNIDSSRLLKVLIVANALSYLAIFLLVLGRFI